VRYWSLASGSVNVAGLECASEEEAEDDDDDWKKYEEVELEVVMLSGVVAAVAEAVRLGLEVA
jgi:hypothetical protein